MAIVAQFTRLVVEYNGVKSRPVIVPVAGVAPGVFTIAGGAGQAVVLNQDSSINGPGAPADRIMTDARLISMALRYRDEGLFARAIRMQAAEQRITEAQLREQLIGMARDVASGPAQAVLREPLERFLRGQARELELVARPPQPIAVGALGGAPPRDAADAQRRYGLTATAR